MDHSKLQIRRQRAPKTTAEQYEVFLDFATRNPIIVDGKRGPLDTEALLHEKWDELADILNSSGRGPQRNTREWQNTFSNWKNSIRHKMKCIMDGTSRTMLNELEGRALQLWDLGAYNGLPRYARKREAPAPQADTDGGQDESTHSSSAFYLGRHFKDEYSVNGDHSQQSHTHSISHVEQNGTAHDESALLVTGGSTAATELDDEEDDEYEVKPPAVSLSVAAVSSMTSTPLLTAKRRKYHHHHHQAQLLTAGGTAVGVQRRNGTTASRGGADELDGSILIAESIAKLADNVGQMAESIRDIAAAFTTTTQAAFELIRRQSEIIQGLIEK